MGTLKAFLRSKLNRRIILLFVFCSVVPLSMASVLSYRQVIHHLNDQSFQLLDQTTKTISMSVYERLLFMQTEMTLLGRSGPAEFSPGYSNSVATGTAMTLSDRFNTIMRIDPAGRWHTVLGKAVSPPTLPQIDTTKKRFETYQPLIFADTTAGGRPLPVRRLLAGA